MQFLSIRALIYTVTAIALIAAGNPVFAQTEPMRGVVINKTDKGIKEVQVVLRAAGGGEVIEEQATNEDGQFSFAMESLRPGYELHFHKTGYDDVTLTISPQQLVIANIRVIMQPTIVEPTPVPASKKSDSSQALMMQNQRKKAVELYNEAVELWDEAKAGKDETQINQKKEALRMIRQSASLDPTFSPPLRMLSRLALEQKNWAEASRYAEDLIRIDPTDLEAVRTLYFSMVIMRHHLRIGDAAKRLALIDPASVIHINEHALAFFTNEQYTMAKAMYQVLTEISPDPAGAYFNLGLCCANLGETDETRAAFNKFLELAPEDNPDIETVRQVLADLDAHEAPE